MSTTSKAAAGRPSRARYITIGCLAGIANGRFGAGGGMVVVPLLTRWTGMESRKAFATSLAVILPLSVVSLITYALRGGVDFAAAWPYGIGGAVGGLLGGLLLRKISMPWLRRMFGLLILYGGVRAVLCL